MSPGLHELNLPGPMLARGFWLYVWEVAAPDGGTWLYVGRTGDSSSINAQSPFARLSQHLSQNPKSNALRRHLKNREIDADACREFRLVAYGPILPEEAEQAAHRRSRDVVAALEKALRDALASAGYGVLNRVHSRMSVDEAMLEKVLAEFSGAFPKLSAPNPASIGANGRP